MVARSFKLWWLGNGTEAGGCLLTLGVTLLLLLAVLVVLWPFGQSTAATGDLVGFGMRETERGSRPVAYVVAEGVQGRVRLYPSDRCDLGDKVEVRLKTAPWGKSVVRGRADQLCPS